METISDIARLFKLLTDCITMIFLAITLSYYFLLFYRPRQAKPEKSFNSLTIIIPAHNEERYIEACIRSAQAAELAN